MIKFFAFVVPVFGLVGAAFAQPAAHSHAAMAEDGVVIFRAMKDSGVKGTLMLTQHGNDLMVKGEVTGLKPGKHGFHIHQYGDLRDAEGKSAGGHYNPSGAPHAGPHDSAHHAGDLGNIEADSSGKAQVNTTAKGVKLQEVLGRSFVIHADPDDLKSQPAGNAGPRVAVGIIAAAEAKKETAAAK
jgi:Cu-Zn family superoxide dismutase